MVGSQPLLGYCAGDIVDEILPFFSIARLFCTYFIMFTLGSFSTRMTRHIYVDDDSDVGFVLVLVPRATRGGF